MKYAVREADIVIELENGTLLRFELNPVGDNGLQVIASSDGSVEVSEGILNAAAADLCELLYGTVRIQETVSGLH